MRQRGFPRSGRRASAAGLFDLRQREEAGFDRLPANQHLLPRLRVNLPNRDERPDPNGRFTLANPKSPLIPRPHRQDIDVGVTLIGPIRESFPDLVKDDLDILMAHAASARDARGGGR